MYRGVSFSRGAIYKILSNPIYVGEIAHQGERHAGMHEGIIDRQTWEAVQQRLQENAVRKKQQATAQSPSLLAGLIFDETGEPLTPVACEQEGPPLSLLRFPIAPSGRLILSNLVKRVEIGPERCAVARELLGDGPANPLGRSGDQYPLH